MNDDLHEDLREYNDAWQGIVGYYLSVKRGAIGQENQRHTNLGQTVELGLLLENRQSLGITADFFLTLLIWW